MPLTRADRLVAAARSQVGKTVEYDPSYSVIAYPMGDVPLRKGVCTDVIIRAYRSIGIDLQKLVHLDMSQRFSAYPKRWGLSKPDRNIDHRRVPNLRTYLKRAGAAKGITAKPEDYLPGDIVTWELPGGREHIGLVSQSDGRARRVVHNIGAGAKEEDILMAWKITGHYRYRVDR